jgi:undecaprenyl-diphosphatase
MFESEGFRRDDLRRDAPHRSRAKSAEGRAAPFTYESPQVAKKLAATDRAATSAARPWPRRLIGALLLVALVTLPIDVAVARWCAAGNVPKNVHRLLEIGEDFGHGIGVGLIALAVFALDPERRRTLLRVLTGAYGAGLAADAMKIVIVRYRPRELNLHSTGVLETFDGLLGFAVGHSHSFPSAHTATGVGLAMLLTWLYPRGRWYFAFLAVLVGAQRVVVGAHFLSDVFVGAATGVAIGWCCTGWERGSRRFTRFEARGMVHTAKVASKVRQ